VKIRYREDCKVSVSKNHSRTKYGGMGQLKRRNGVGCHGAAEKRARMLMGRERLRKGRGREMIGVKGSARGRKGEGASGRYPSWERGDQWTRIARQLEVDWGKQGQEKCRKAGTALARVYSGESMAKTLLEFASGDPRRGRKTVLIVRRPGGGKIQCPFSFLRKIQGNRMGCLKGKKKVIEIRRPRGPSLG